MENIEFIGPKLPKEIEWLYQSVPSGPQPRALYDTGTSQHILIDTIFDKPKKHKEYWPPKKTESMEAINTHSKLTKSRKYIFHF